MIAVVSPAKTLDFGPEISQIPASTPLSLDKSQQLINALRKYSVPKLMALMDISKPLAELNYLRYKEWTQNFSEGQTKKAIEAFKGDVYLGLAVEQFTKADFEFANDHLRILSGLHGVLRPMDLIKPYRLEMGIPLKVGRNKNLYSFWSAEVTNRLNEELSGHSYPIIVNLASVEYFSVVDIARLNRRILHISFKQKSKGEYKILSFHAKRARGMMASYIIKNQIHDPEYLRHFNDAGYAFNETLSSTNEFIFTRD